jgi:hypothetical protein
MFEITIWHRKTMRQHPSTWLAGNPFQSTDDCGETRWVVFPSKHSDAGVAAGQKISTGEKNLSL